jgi:hypothetical protein
LRTFDVAAWEGHEDYISHRSWIFNKLINNFGAQTARGVIKDTSRRNALAETHFFSFQQLNLKASSDIGRGISVMDGAGSCSESVTDRLSLR